MYNKAIKHEVASLRKNIGILLMSPEQGIKLYTSENILTEVHYNG